MTPTQTAWQHLAPNPKSAYKQLFVKGTRIRAEVIYGWTVDGSEPVSAEEAAAGYGLPIEAVREAIAYCESNPPEVREDHRREEARMRAAGVSGSGHSGKPRLRTAQEIARPGSP